MHLSEKQKNTLLGDEISSEVKASRFDDFTVSGYFLYFQIPAVRFESCTFRNIKCSQTDSSVIYFQNNRIEVSKSLFSQCQANRGSIYTYCSSTKYPKYFTLNQTLMLRIESTEIGESIGSRSEFHCHENNLSQCSSDARITDILFDVCSDMVARFVQFENSNTTAPLVEVYHDDDTDRVSHLLTIMDCNIFNNHNQRSFFFVWFRHLLKLKLQSCHFLNNDPCNFYSRNEYANLEVEILDTNFDIPKEHVFLPNFNLGTDGITFGVDVSFPFERRNYGAICNGDPFEATGSARVGCCLQLIFSFYLGV